MLDKPIRLTTRRLVLREFASDDWRAVHQYASDPLVVQYMGWGPNNEQQTQAFIGRAMSLAAQRPRREFELAVVLKEQQRLAGGCGLTIEQRDHDEGFLGYCYARAAWGQGYATEAAGAMLQFGFEQCGLHRIFATCDVRNIGSWRVMEKLGMHREGCLREHRRFRGEWRDSFVYAVLCQEWQAQQSAEHGTGD